jgi:molecular chaperone DnaK (HSP70)
MKRIFGIDLGTTYSCIAYVDEMGKPVIASNFEGDLTTPSAVHFESPENIVVGKEAKNAAKLFPDRVVEFVKRHMGDPTFSYEVDGVAYKPEAVSSFILRKLVSDAAQALGEEIEDVVITCPAYFGNNEREATKNAGELAGLNVHLILNEPTAAAVCYGVDSQTDDQVVLVYDLGGGTFDVTVIAIEQGNIRVVVTGGDHSLGGKDWDDRLTKYLGECFQNEHPSEDSPLGDNYSFQELAKAAEEAKKALSSREKYPLMVSHNGKRTRVELTRETLDEITNDLLDRTITLTKHLLEDAKKKGFDRIDQILLVGGSSKTPSVARRMEEVFGQQPRLFEPDLAVAKGAALVGVKILAGEMIREEIAKQAGLDKEGVDLDQVDRKKLETAAQAVSGAMGGALRLPAPDLVDIVKRKIVNVCSKGFGVVVIKDARTMEEAVAYLIHNNTPLPAEYVETGFSTLKDNQRAVLVRIMEQAGETESPDLNNNNPIGEGEITGLPPNLPADSPIHVTFRLEEDGTLRVTAVEPSSGASLKLNLSVDGVMGREEVEEMKGMLLKKNVS